MEKITLEKLIEKLKALAEASKGPHGDPESAHADADDLLLAFISDAEVDAAYASIKKWYS